MNRRYYSDTLRTGRLRVVEAPPCSDVVRVGPFQANAGDLLIINATVHVNPLHKSTKLAMREIGVATKLDMRPGGLLGIAAGVDTLKHKKHLIVRSDTFLVETSRTYSVALAARAFSQRERTYVDITKASISVAIITTH
jgi:hypothetical protein